MTAFPGAEASFTGFTSGHTLQADAHGSQHNLEQSEIVATQHKIGTGSSTPASGLLLRGTGVGTSSWAQANLTSDVTGVLPQANGGTGTTLATGTGKAVYDTLPTISSPILTTPNIVDFTNAQHDHGDTDDAGPIVAAAIPTGAITYPRLAAGATRIGINRSAGGTLANTYSDYATVTGSSNGGEVECEVGMVVGNGNSGADRTFDVRVLCDGVAITPSAITGMYAPFVSGATPNYGFTFNFSSTPASGSHTWKLQLEASTGGAVVLSVNYLKVAEVI